MAPSFVEVAVKKLTKTAQLPTYATDGSGAFDIYADENVIIKKGTHPYLVRTGLAMAIPKGWMMIIIPRSSAAIKWNLRMPHSAGLIDSDYRGEILVGYEYKGKGEHAISPGDRIAQGFLLPVNKAVFVEASELNKTERGAGGFGSTGK